MAITTAPGDPSQGAEPYALSRALRSAPGRNRTSARGLGNRCYPNHCVQKVAILVQKMDGRALLLYESYSARLARQGLASGTRAKYLAAVRHYLSWLANTDAVAATRQEVDSYLDAWHAESSPSPNTIRLRLSALKSFYSYLDDRELLHGRNPVERIKAPRVRRKPNDRLSTEEDGAMLKACSTEQETALIWLLRWTGLRVGEALALCAEDVDFARREIRVSSSKTQSGMRTVPFVDELGAVLLARLDTLRSRDDWSPRMPLLATGRGTPMKEQFAWRLVKRVAHRAGVRILPAPALSSVTPHTLRRTYGSDLLNRGVRMEAVSKLLGHADVRVTAACYAELLDETVRDEVRRAMAS
jgi:site-specific recombinase XerD